LLLGACATPTTENAPAPYDVPSRFPFLTAGETRVREAFDRLGDPFHRHDVDHVYVWTTAEDQDGRVRITDADPKDFPLAWPKSRYELVLQFDADEKFVRGSMIRVW
jgi:hypothetical protein